MSNNQVAAMAARSDLPATFSALNTSHKQTIGLLSIGTILEYFDLMLYVHLVGLLNDFFFPATDHNTAVLLSVFAFCSSYMLRPFGAMLFGYIGDKWGRKLTITITTFLMAISCLVMANVPTYAQIGIAASIIVTLCRVLQGVSSVAEFTGVQLYLTESLRPPIRYPAVMLMPMSVVFGTTLALFMANQVISRGINWRYLFWFGGAIALIGFFTRTKLQETTDFIQAKNYQQLKINSTSQAMVKPFKLTVKTILALLLLYAAWPLCSYFTYIYSGNILKADFGLNATQILHENLLISIGNLIVIILVTYGSYKFQPLKLAKILLIPFFITLLCGPYYLINNYTADNLFVFRALILWFAPYNGLIAPSSFMRLPTAKRFTYAGVAIAVSNSIFYCLAPLAMVFLINNCNYWGVTIIVLPLVICFCWAANYFGQSELNNQENSVDCSYVILNDNNKITRSVGA